jgi:hypothetical protein
MFRANPYDMTVPYSYSRPIDLRGFVEVFYSNMNIDESKRMEDQYLSQDMMAVHNGRYTIDVGYYGEHVIVINVFTGKGWQESSVMQIYCDTYDKLYEQLDIVLRIFSRM